MMAVLNQVVPILASLKRHKLTASLLLLQVVLACSVVSNILSIVAARVSTTGIPTGVDERGLAVLDVASVASQQNWGARHLSMQHAVQALAGVKSAAVVDTLPLGTIETSSGFCGSLDSFLAAMRSHALIGHGCVQAAVISGTSQTLSTLGLRLIEGRDFEPDEYVTQNPNSAIITADLAEKLFGTKYAVGRVIYSGAGTDHAVHIVGVVDHLVRPRIRARETAELTLLSPVIPQDNDDFILVRTTADADNAILQRVKSALLAEGSDLIVAPESVSWFYQLRQRYFSRDTSMIRLLLAASAALLFVTMVGIAGLAKFWVLQRRRQIAVRRALGATRMDILAYFHTENMLITSAGMCVGVPVAFTLSYALVSIYGVAAVSPRIVALSSVIMFLLGQVAVFVPARNAASVAPMEAERQRA